MKIGLICFLVVFISCNSAKKQEEAIPVDEFSELTKVDETVDVSRLNGDMIMFCKTNEPNQIGYSYIYKFVDLFKNQPKYKNEIFNEFISNIIDFKKDFDCGDIVECFSLNDTIVSVYEQSNIETFLGTYTAEYSGGKYRIRNDISFTSQVSVIYFLYKNHYYTAFDDYSGFYYSRKIDDFIDKLININLEEWK